MLPNDISRCCGTDDITTTARTCPERDDCERHAEFKRNGPGSKPAEMGLCKTEAFESRIHRPCAGKGTRVNPTRPHPLCRSGCARWQYGAQNGISPEWRDIDGTASCGDRVVHRQGKVGDESLACAPTR